jgi:hypothetical protein
VSDNLAKSTNIRLEFRHFQGHGGFQTWVFAEIQEIAKTGHLRDRGRG